MSFKDPWILILVPIVIGLIYFLRRKQSAPTLRFSSNALFSGIKSGWKVNAQKSLFFVELVALALFLIALAGPREVLERTEITTEGIDIILTVDASGSMAAMDFELNGKRVNRLEAVKNVVEDFVKGRAGDRIGLVVFASRAYTICPLTTDYDWLIENLKRIELGLVGEDGTAIGSAVTSSLGRLEGRESKSKIVVLLTDGVNNAGKIDPITAAQAAESLGIKVYSIGAGTRGMAPYPVQFFGRTVMQNMRVEIDEETLKQVSKKTNGKYYRATDTRTLREIYKEIDRLEKTEIEETGYREYKQLFSVFVFIALALILIVSVLGNTLLLRIP